MRKLKNWDNNTWLSSKKYILNFNKFLKKKVKLSNQSQILDIDVEEQILLVIYKKNIILKIKQLE